MDALQRIETAKLSIENSLKSLDNDIQSRIVKCDDLHADQAILEQAIADLTVNFERKKADLVKKIAQSNETLAKLLANIEQANKDLAKTRADLDATKKKHKEFMEYRKRANAALESHEKSVLEKEEKLDTMFTMAKRRTSILANV